MGNKENKRKKDLWKYRERRQVDDVIEKALGWRPSPERDRAFAEFMRERELQRKGKRCSMCGADVTDDSSARFGHYDTPVLCGNCYNAID